MSQQRYKLIVKKEQISSRICFLFCFSQCVNHIINWTHNTLFAVASVNRVDIMPAIMCILTISKLIKSAMELCVCKSAANGWRCDWRNLHLFLSLPFESICGHNWNNWTIRYNVYCISVAVQNIHSSILKNSPFQFVYLCDFTINLYLIYFILNPIFVV